MPDIDSMVRVGVVSSIDAEKKRARVYFPDRGNVVSGWLFVLQRTGETIQTEEEADHSHEGTVGGWMPGIGDVVLTVYPAGWNTDGYILGVIP